MNLMLEPVGTVLSSRSRPVDDGWDRVDQRIQLSARFAPETLAGLDAFSHIEVLYLFHLVDPADIVVGARHPRGCADWPKVGIFAQRAKARPNRLGATICALERVDGRTLFVRGLDAIDGTPVIDIKPVMEEFLPRGQVREPDWAHELMKEYW